MIALVLTLCTHLATGTVCEKVAIPQPSPEVCQARADYFDIGPWEGGYWAEQLDGATMVDHAECRKVD